MSERRAKGSGTIWRKTYPNGHTAWVAERRWKDETGKARRVSAEGATDLIALTRLATKLASIGSEAVEGSQSAAAAPKGTKAPESAPKPSERRRRAPTTLNGHLTLTDYTALWSEKRGNVSERVRRQERRVIENHLLPLLGNREIRTLRENDLTRALETLRTTTLAGKPTALRNVYRCSNIFFTHAEKMGHISKNPLRNIQRPPIKKKNDSALMAVRLTKLRGLLGWMNRRPSNGGLTVAEERPQEWARLLIALLGLRPEEALGLTWDNVYLVKRGKVEPYILVKQVLMRYEPGEKREGQENYYLRQGTKNGETRRVPLDKNTVAALTAWKMAAPADPWKNLVFCTPEGKNWTLQADRKRWAALLEEAQKNHKEKSIWSIGWTRHIAITLLLDSGAPQAVVTAMMGHTAVVENRHYYAPQEAAQRKALDEMHRALPFLGEKTGNGGKS